MLIFNKRFKYYAKKIVFALTKITRRLIAINGTAVFRFQRLSPVEIVRSVKHGQKLQTDKLLECLSSYFFWAVQFGCSRSKITKVDIDFLKR